MAENEHVREPVIRHAKSKGWLARRLVMLNRRGYPDTTFMKGGIVLIMEFKDVDGELSMLQEREILKLERAGMKVFVIDDPKRGCNLIDIYDASLPSA